MDIRLELSEFHGQTGICKLLVSKSKWHKHDWSLKPKEDSLREELNELLECYCSFCHSVGL